MIKAILIDQKEEDLDKLEKTIFDFCPQICITGKASSIRTARSLIKKELPNLLFFDIIQPIENIEKLLKILPPFDFESVVVTSLKGYEEEALKYNISGYIQKPIQKKELLIAVENARKRILLKEENKKNKELLQKLLSQLSGNELIGIPTLEGFDFYPVAEIIRCEGMQRCTRIITRGKSNIISSYNLGEFRRLLEPYGFFSSHKSHLINLGFVKQYKREGVVILIDNFPVPVSRTRKVDFLQRMTHL